MTATADSVVYRAGRGSSSGAADADSMKHALVRTAFSPVIYFMGTTNFRVEAAGPVVRRWR